MVRCLPSPEWQVFTVDFEKVLERPCKLIIWATMLCKRQLHVAGILGVVFVLMYLTVVEWFKNPH